MCVCASCVKKREKEGRGGEQVCRGGGPYTRTFCVHVSVCEKCGREEEKYRGREREEEKHIKDYETESERGRGTVGRKEKERERSRLEGERKSACEGEKYFLLLTLTKIR